MTKEEQVEEVARFLDAFGAAIRHNWGDIDGRCIRDDMETAASALRGEPGVTYENLCELAGIHPTQTICVGWMRKDETMTDERHKPAPCFDIDESGGTWWFFCSGTGVGRGGFATKDEAIAATWEHVDAVWEQHPKTEELRVEVNESRARYTFALHRLVTAEQQNDKLRVELAEAKHVLWQAHHMARDAYLYVSDPHDLPARVMRAVDEYGAKRGLRDE